jgi:hypothetical protein
MLIRVRPRLGWIVLKSTLGKRFARMLNGTGYKTAQNGFQSRVYKQQYRNFCNKTEFLKEPNIDCFHWILDHGENQWGSPWWLWLSSNSSYKNMCEASWFVGWGIPTRAFHCSVTSSEVQHFAQSLRNGPCWAPFIFSLCKQKLLLGGIST